MTTVKAIRIHGYGGPEILRYEDVALDAPEPGEALVRHCAIGLNFADIRSRTGCYPLPELPGGLGGDGMGIVEAVGVGVQDIAVGDRVVYSSGVHALPRESYCKARVMSAAPLIRLPETVDDQSAAAMITKGLTVQYILCYAYTVAPGDSILVHAAGGVGSILVQWARHLGAQVIGVVGSEAKARQPDEDGCSDIIVAGGEDIAARVRAVTDGEGVAAVYDSVDRDIFRDSLESLRPRGTLVSFGTAFGPVPPLDVFEPNTLGSLYVTSATFHWHMRTRGNAGSRGRFDRGGYHRGRPHPGKSALPAGRCGARASRPESAIDHGDEHTDTLSRRGGGRSR